MKRSLKFIGCALITIFIGAGFLYFSPIVRMMIAVHQDVEHTINLQNSDPIPFQQVVWLQSGHGSKLYVKAFRQRMLNDLFKRYHLVGMTRKQLEELLGPGTDKWKPEMEISYPLGYFGLADDMWLAFEIKHGVVTKYIVTPD